VTNKVRFVQIQLAANDGGVVLAALDDKGRIWVPKGNITFPFGPDQWDQLQNPSEPTE